LAALIGLLVLAVSLLPGLGDLRSRFEHADAVWIVIGVALEVMSALSYVLAFKGVFCRKMGWRTAYKIAGSELGADSLLPVGGAGGLALGVWALRRGGMPSADIARKTVAFFLLTSVPNVSSLAVLSLGMAVGILPGNANLALTIVPAAVAIGGVALTLSLRRLARKLERHLERRDSGQWLKRIAAGARTGADGVDEALRLLRQRNPLVLIGVFGYLVFDAFVLVVAFHALGSSPEITIVCVAYIIGQLGNLLPLPGGIGGVEAGLIGTLVLYGQPAALSTAAVLIYRTIQLWIPAFLGVVAFIRLRVLLRHEADAIVTCKPGDVIQIIGHGPVVAE
jgi:uncharacterized protein (TIRG00374 family)